GADAFQFQQFTKYAADTGAKFVSGLLFVVAAVVSKAQQGLAIDLAAAAQRHAVQHEIAVWQHPVRQPLSQMQVPALFILVWHVGLADNKGEQLRTLIAGAASGQTYGLIDGCM